MSPQLSRKALPKVHNTFFSRHYFVFKSEISWALELSYLELYYMYSILYHFGCVPSISLTTVVRQAFYYSRNINSAVNTALQMYSRSNTID